MSCLNTTCIKPTPRPKSIGNYNFSYSQKPIQVIVVEQEKPKKQFLDAERTSVLSKEEERKYLLLASQGDEAARNVLVEHNLRLVAYVARSYSRTQDMFDELFSEGYFVLFHAIDRFDLSYDTKFSTYACVPLSTRILTKVGLKEYNELVPGDETLGYDNGHLKWTPINGFYFNKEANLFEFGDSMWSTHCTDQHKWLMSIDGDIALRPLDEWPDSYLYESECNRKKQPKVELITSAPFVGGNSKITPDEAALLAWVFSDGSEYGDWKNRNPSGACIIQSENKFVKDIQNLLYRLGIPIEGKKHGNCLAFNVKNKFYRKVFEKADLKHQTMSEFVLTLSPEARKSWFDTWYKAEGTLGKKYITQNNGESLDAIALTAYLEGLKDVQIRKKNKNCSVVRWHSRNRNPRRCFISNGKSGPIWCPNTGLGSWTAVDESGNIFLTGNTWWLRQSMSKYLQTKNGNGLADQLDIAFTDDDCNLEFTERIDLMRNCLYLLTDRECDIIRRRFGIDCECETLDKIGCDYCLSKERIRQIESKAMEKIRPLILGLM